MQTDANRIAEESLASKSFRASSAVLDQPQLKSAGSGFESLAAHSSPGHAGGLGFLLPAGRLLLTSLLRQWLTRAVLHRSETSSGASG